MEKQALDLTFYTYTVTLVLIFTIHYKPNLITIYIFLKADMGLEDEQIKVLKNCFDGFADEDGAIPADNIGNILEMMGLKGNNWSIPRTNGNQKLKLKTENQISFVVDNWTFYTL